MEMEILDLADLEILEEAVAPCGWAGCGAGLSC
jgi:hypothetical protein